MPSLEERYVKQVQKELRGSRKLKQEVARDLREAFESAAEHGETGEQLAARLGEPRAFAANVAEGAGGRRRRGRKGTAGVCVLSAVSAACLVPALLSVFRQTPPNVIGQADGTTLIFVTGSPNVNLPALLLSVGCAAAVGAVLLAVSVRKRKRG